jgi:FkbM family methyltransferase
VSSTQQQDAIFDVDPTIRVIHVGGGGGIGPVECLYRLGKNMSLITFEANIEGGDAFYKEWEDIITDYANRYGIKLSIMPNCLFSQVGKKEFHINVMPDCSSLFNMSPDAKNYQRMAGEYRIVWGQICQPARTIEIDVTSLDELYTNGQIEMPHFLSLDAQGAEYNILEGASKALQGDLVGVITEVEFSELYEAQKLFTDQYSLLRKHQFNLFELYNPEYWYSGPMVGKGALMVGEALFLRNFQYFVRKYKDPDLLLLNLSRLAIVSHCFGRSSYAFEILAYIMDNWQHEWGIFINQKDSKYLHDLMEFYRKTERLKHQQEEVPNYMEFMVKGISPRRKLMPKLKKALGLAYTLNLKTIVYTLRKLRVLMSSSAGRKRLWLKVLKSLR